MKLKLPLLITLLLVIPFFSIIAVAIPDPLGLTSIQQLIDKLTYLILQLAVMVAPIMLIIAGFFFVTSAGDPKRVDTAKKMVMWTLIGLGVVFMGRIIVSFIQGILV